MNFDKPFWSTLFRDADGTASSSRVLTTVVVFTTLFCVTFVTCVHKALPDLIPVEHFLSSVVLSLYGVSKVTDAVKKLTTPCATQ